MAAAAAAAAAVFASFAAEYCAISRKSVLQNRSSLILPGTNLKRNNATDGKAVNTRGARLRYASSDK